MAKDKKFVEAITDMEQDFPQWYTDVVLKAELVNYSSVRGCMIIKPYGYAIWELMQRQIDDRFKATGHENVYMPMLIPEGLLEKEKDHVEGFAPEVAWVTHGGSEKLHERLCIRPTSETLFCEHYANIIHSWRDLPKLYNQWCSVVRWEKTTRPFLRSCEFLWQEGHTIHATAEEAQEETLRMLHIYAEICENVLAIPVIKGKKTEKEKFAGAIDTYTIEAMMHDGKALQSGTTHYFGDGFAKAFDIEYTDKNNKQIHPHQTSWGVSTRLIGGIIMTHGDDNGLVLPPKIAPTQVVIIPVAAHKAGVLEKAEALRVALQSAGFRVKMDDSDNSPGWKFAEYEMKGVPLRVEIGPRDIENNQCVLVSRVNNQKSIVSLDNLADETGKALDGIQQALYQKALQNRVEHTFEATTYQELADVAETSSGFYKVAFCGSRDCEDKVKDEIGLSTRCMPLDEKISDGAVCAICGKPATTGIYFGRAY